MKLFQKTPIQRAASLGLAALLLVVLGVIASDRPQKVEAAGPGPCIPLDNGQCWRPVDLVFHVPDGWHYVRQAYGGTYGEVRPDGSIVIKAGTYKVNAKTGDVSVPVWVARELGQVPFGRWAQRGPYRSDAAYAHALIQPADYYTVTSTLGAATPLWKAGLKPPGMQPYLTDGPSRAGSDYTVHPAANLVDCFRTGSAPGVMTCPVKNLAPNQVAYLNQISKDHPPLGGTLYVNVEFVYRVFEAKWYGRVWTYRWWPPEDIIKLPEPQWCTYPWLMDVPSTVQPGQSFTALVGLGQKAGEQLVVERVAGAYSGHVDATKLPVYESRTVTTGPGGTAKVTFTLPASARLGSRESGLSQS